MIARALWAALVFSLSAYFLAIGVRDAAPTADLFVLSGAVLFAGGVFILVFSIKRYMSIRQLERHVKGKAAGRNLA